MIDALATDLPIAKLYQPLADHWQRHQLAVIKAPPGAGKSTQLPLWCLHWLTDQPGQIWLIQPRRLACKALAARLASLLDEPVGHRVGFQIGLEQRVSAQCRILVMTQGVLLQKLQQDPGLTPCVHLLLDEYHERQWQADLALALLHQLTQLRDDFRLWLLSATLDLAPLAERIGAQAFACDGRQYPIELSHRPLDTPNWAELIAEQLALGAQGILVFMPGWKDIQQALTQCRSLAMRWPQVRVQCLHSRLDKDEQYQVLNATAEQGPRVIFSTNIAETSLTLAGIDLVIDTGWVNSSVLDSQTGLSRWQQQRIAQSNADQRAGRAGRLAPGRCLRLWPESDVLPPQPLADIRQADLRPLCLMLALLKESATDLLWLDPPNPYALAKAEQQLCLLGALNEGGITPLGQQLLALGTDLSLASMLMQAPTSQIAEAASLAAWLHLWPQQLPDAPARPSSTDYSLLLQRFCQARGQPTRFQWPQQPGDLLVLGMPERLWCADHPTAKLASGRAIDKAPMAVKGWQLAFACQVRDGKLWLQNSLPVSTATVHGLSQHWRQNQHFSWQQDRLQVWQTNGFLAIELSRQPGKLLLADWQQQVILRLQQSDWPSFLTPELTNWLRRWQCWADVEAHCPSPAEWVAQLPQQLPLWLTSVSSLANLPWRALWQDFLGPQAAILAQQLPPTLRLPIGLDIRIDYQQRPALAQVKLQAAFGLTKLPALANGRLPLALELLAPNGRVLARTMDLQHFWQIQYPMIRKENRARYSKHPWPEDPFGAEATLKTNAQLRKT